MTRFVLSLVAVVAVATLASAVPQTGDTKSVNGACPISGETVDGRTFSEVDGLTVGFCCASCQKTFARWSPERQEKFAYGARDKKATKKKVASTQPTAVGDPYLLTTCPVSGEKLGSMGDPVVKKYDGREVRFCCNGCVGRFEKDQAKYTKAIDEKMVAAQMPLYPVDTCLMMGDPLVEDGEDISVNVIYRNRLLRLCCKSCARQLKKNPAKTMADLDKLVADAQRADYPLDTCVVAGGKLGSMGEPAEIVVGNRLVRFCCAGCIGGFKKDPAKYVAKIDAARAKQ